MNSHNTYPRTHKHSPRTLKLHDRTLKLLDRTLKLLDRTLKLPDRTLKLHDRTLKCRAMHKTQNHSILIKTQAIRLKGWHLAYKVRSLMLKYGRLKAKY